MITAVLPLTVRDLERARILFASLAKYFNPADLAQVLLFAPDAEAAEVRRWAAPQVLPHRVVNDSEICGDTTGVSGWHVQQIVKLGAWRFVDTLFYLTLDADVICTKPTSYQDLVRNGLGRQHRESRAGNPQWWRRSARLLRMWSSWRKDGMGVTPLVYATEGTRQLTAELDRLHGNWVQVLKEKHLWAEHALYDLFLEKMKLRDKFHFTAPIYGPCVWQREPFEITS